MRRGRSQVEREQHESLAEGAAAGARSARNARESSADGAIADARSASPRAGGIHALVAMLCLGPDTLAAEQAARALANLCKVISMDPVFSYVYIRNVLSGFVSRASA